MTEGKQRGSYRKMRTPLQLGILLHLRETDRAFRALAQERRRSILWAWRSGCTFDDMAEAAGQRPDAIRHAISRWNRYPDREDGGRNYPRERSAS